MAHELLTKQNPYHLEMIQTKKYKTNNIVIKLKEPLNKETITKRALLPSLLRNSTKTLHTRQAFARELDELYGAVLRTDTAKKGDHHIISLRLELPNEKYLSADEQLLERAIKLLSDTLYDANVTNNSFDEAIVQREKETLKNRITSVQDDKMAFANQRLIDEMCSEELFSVHTLGYAEDLRAISGKKMFDYYKHVLETNEITIYFVGDFDGIDLERLVGDNVRAKKASEHIRYESSARENVSLRKEAQTIIETEPIHQAKLHLGYRTGVTIADEHYASLQVFNGLFGGFPHSKLFMNVREKHSLAYYAASRIEGHKGLMIVMSGIASEDYEQARQIIEQQLEELRAGEITEQLIAETKQLLVHSVKNTLDNPQGAIEFDYQYRMNNKSCSPEQYIEQINQVTKNDIIARAQEVTLDTVYLLTSESSDVDE